jgi:hypothetical protein
MKLTSQIVALCLIGCSSPQATQMAGEVLLTPDPNARRQVWMFTDSGSGFVAHNTPIARDMSSLGLGVVDGELWLTGLCWWPGCGSEAEMERRRSEGPLLFGIATRDLNEWRALQWRLKGAGDLTPIDPEIRQTDSGVVLWYYGVSGSAHVDPMNRDTHEIHTASLQGDNFVETGLLLSARGLGDPAPISYRGNELLFATTEAAQASAVFSGEPLRLASQMRGVSVPFAFEVNGVLWLLASKIVNGHPTPVRATSTDGVTYSQWEQFLPTGNMEGCSSPVGAVVGETIAVFCVNEPTLPG